MVSPLVSTIKFFAYQIFVHGTMIKKNAPHFFYLNPCIGKRQISCKFQFHSKIFKAFIGSRMNQEK